MDQVRVAQFIDLQEAQIAAGLLQSHGLLVHLQNEQLGAVDFLIRQAIGGFGLWVPEDQEDEAKAALAAVTPLPPEPETEAEPEPAGEAGPGRTFLGVIAGAIGVVLWPLGWPVALLIRHRRWPASLTASGLLIAVVLAMIALIAIALLWRLAGGYHGNGYGP